MTTAIFSIPNISCEDVKSYKLKSPERVELIKEYDQMMKKIIDLTNDNKWKKKLLSKKKISISPPHNHKHIVAYCHYGNQK